MKYSVTSVMLPDLDLIETCRLVNKLGFGGVEWRIRCTPAEAIGKRFSFWGRHKTGLSPSNIATRAAEVQRVTEDHGLAIPAIASNVQAGDVENIKRLGDGVARMGTIPVHLNTPRGYDRSVPYPALYAEAVDAFGKSIEILKPLGLKALLEIHRNTIAVSAALAW